MTHPIRVVVLEKRRLAREALAFALGHQPTMNVILAADDLTTLAATLAGADPHVFVVDLGLPQREGLAQVRTLSQRWPRAAILITGLSELDSDVIACCEAGARGYLREDGSLKQLVERIKSVVGGEMPCSPRVAALLFERLRDRTRELQQIRTTGPRLTAREVEIIGLIDERLSNKEIAARLNIEVQTVKNHVHNILEKLELEGRWAAVRYARERGLLTLLPISGRDDRPKTALPDH